MQVNWIGVLVNVLYILALGFYLWVRITKTLDLGSYSWYGYLVLAIECLGATTIISYGINLLWNPVNEIEMDENNPGKPKVYAEWCSSTPG